MQNAAVKLIKRGYVSPFSFDKQAVISGCESMKLPTGETSIVMVKLKQASGKDSRLPIWDERTFQIQRLA
ncbi:hypothetical protein QUW64_10070 [Mediterranea massiliensis]|nr:hypothetical protein [Mediterranea massiliensis]